MANYCPDCYDNDELVVMEKHEWPVEGYCKLVCWVRKLSFKKFQEKILTTDFIILCANCHIEIHAGLWKYGE